MSKRVVKSLVLLGILVGPGLFIILFSKGSSKYVTLDFFGEYQLIERVDSQGKSVVDSVPYQVFDFPFTNQFGDNFRLTDFEGKTIIVHFYNDKMHIWQIQKDFLNVDDVVILSISSNPDFSELSQLSYFGKKNDAKQGKWHLILNTPEEAKTLASDYFFTSMLKPGSDIEELLKVETCLLLDKNRNIRGVYDISFSDEITRLSDETRLVIKEHFLKSKEG
jgi:protein SCO1